LPNFGNLQLTVVLGCTPVNAIIMEINSNRALVPYPVHLEF